MKVPLSLFVFAVLLPALVSAPALAQDGIAPVKTLITNARIFDGKADALTGPMNLLITGNIITTVSAAAITGDAASGATLIDAGGGTLMPGLIDAHAHLSVMMLTPFDTLKADGVYIGVASTRAAEDVLMRGFTSVRDLGGATFGLKRAIDNGIVKGPRIWPSGAMISQSGGHGDFRGSQEMPAAPGQMSFMERVGMAAIADSPDAVRQAAREQLALGATQIKMMAGGGVSSNYDPLDVTQYTVEELRAGVQAAENWGTYVTVHAYTPKAVRQALEAGVKCIEHGQLLDEDTAKLMAEKGVWWNLQPFLASNPSAFPEGSPNRIKQLEMCAGTDVAYKLAKKHGIKTGWGSDLLLNPAQNVRQGQDVVNLTTWYTPAEALRMVTSENAQLLALSGKRTPYEGKLGVIESGALADLIIVDGDPIADIKLVADPAKNFVLIMKDGVVYKNAIK